MSFFIWKINYLWLLRINDENEWQIFIWMCARNWLKWFSYCLYDSAETQYENDTLILNPSYVSKSARGIGC